MCAEILNKEVVESLREETVGRHMGRKFTIANWGALFLVGVIEEEAGREEKGGKLPARGRGMRLGGDSASR